MPDAPPPNAALDAHLRTQHALAHMLAHDMRNPLAAIIANLSYLEHACAEADPEVRETLADIQTSADVLLKLVESMVTIATLESPDARSAARASVSLAEVAAAAVEAHAAAAARTATRLEAQARVDARVLGDRALLEAMAGELVANGLQHTRRGGAVTLRVERDGARAALALVDDGAPFGPPERHFTREAQPEIKLAAGGRYSRGLGLYLVGLVARTFDGTIAPSREGGRSVLRVWLPSAEGAAVEGIR